MTGDEPLTRAERLALVDKVSQTLVGEVFEDVIAQFLRDGVPERTDEKLTTVEREADGLTKEMLAGRATERAARVGEVQRVAAMLDRPGGAVENREDMVPGRRHVPDPRAAQAVQKAMMRIREDALRQQRKRELALRRSEAAKMELEVMEKNRERVLEERARQRSDDLAERVRRSQEERERRAAQRAELVADEKRRAVDRRKSAGAGAPKPLWVAMEEEYKKRVEAPEVERHKKRMQEIHKAHRPLDHNEMREHQARVDAGMQRRKQDVARRSQQAPLDAAPDFYKSKARLQIEQEEMAKKQPKPDMRAQGLQKRQQYAQQAQERFQPRISEEKQKEVHKRRERYQRLPGDPSSPRRTQSAKSPGRPSQREAVRDQGASGDGDGASPPPREPVRPARKSRATSGGASPQARRVAAGQDGGDRVDAARRKAREAGRGATQSELATAAGDAGLARLETRVEEQTQVSSMYIDAIKAQLDRLQEAATADGS